MKKHKIFLYPLEENGKVRVFLFQSGDIGKNRGSERLFRHPNGSTITSSYGPQLESDVFVNGLSHGLDFKISKKILEKEEFDKLKELERAYNNR